MSVYLDYNAMAPLRKSAAESMVKAMSYVGNPSSVHSFGRFIKGQIESARCLIGEALAVSPDCLVFTSGATEANNLALQGFKGRVFVSAIEHSSVLQARNSVTTIPVTDKGKVDLESLESLLKEVSGSFLVSVMTANNETGIFQPLEEIIDITKRYGGIVHTDAAQAVGKIKFPWKGLDMISVSSPKVGGPAGVGALVINPNCQIQAIVKGGGQERFYRAGTENIIGIIGMAAAFSEAAREDWTATEEIRDRLEQKLEKIRKTACPFLGRKDRLPNTAIAVMPSVKSETQVMAFDLEGFAVSAGAACSSGKVQAFPVWEAMGVPPSLSRGAVRISLGPDVTEEMVSSFSEAWGELYQKVGSPAVSPL